MMASMIGLVSLILLNAPPSLIAHKSVCVQSGRGAKLSHLPFALLVPLFLSSDAGVSAAVMTPGPCLTDCNRCLDCLLLCLFHVA
jgi:hypothetical protein